MIAPVDVHIASMTDDDYDEVLALWQAAEGVGLNGADTRENIAAYLARNPGLSLVARDRGRIVGAVLCGHDGRRGYLHHLAVARESRHNGVGRRLVETCLSRLAAEGIQRCNIFLYADNEPGERFWKRDGWTERPELKILSKPTSGARPDGQTEGST